MSKFGGWLMIGLVLGIGTASANNGILFSNSSDPYFTTPAEFVALGQQLNGKVVLERGISVVATRDTAATDPARGGSTGK
ncbi:hypothetical protein [Rhabdaerophilum sp. SD176]|uniref:hypothetical protein n=1 Tax=Rhabdaerophilum sp. SD176 TaxID=2983548 RepID=UPI0024DFFF4E|nr:hypothetical protein [Rhabdaerophilum sp. SD176]